MKSATAKFCLGFIACVSLIILGGVIKGEEQRPTALSKPENQNGKFSILTYNVAGLPEPLSGSQPIRNTPLISPRLNDFDIVVTQEDFWYHKQLRAQAKHPYYAPRNRKKTLGDGLSRFSKFPMSEVRHVSWGKCYGYLRHESDCMTAKGFSFARHEIGPGVWLDLYDLHMEAGNDPADDRVHLADVEQLIAAIEANSAGRAVIVAGDLNFETSAPDQAGLARLLDGARLIDTCRAFNGGCERNDRVLFRNSDALELKPVAYQVETERFADDQGAQLSDHEAVSAVFEWSSPLK